METILEIGRNSRTFRGTDMQGKVHRDDFGRYFEKQVKAMSTPCVVMSAQ